MQKIRQTTNIVDKNKKPQVIINEQLFTIHISFVEGPVLMEYYTFETTRFT